MHFNESNEEKLSQFLNGKFSFISKLVVTLISKGRDDTVVIMEIF